VQYAEEMESLNTSISSVYWCMFHKPPADEAGGCKFDDLTWGKRKREYDEITWEAAKQSARETVVEYDETSPLERDDEAADMLGAAGRFANRYDDAQDGPYAGVNLYYSDDE
jgi:hypothetical protein